MVELLVAMALFAIITAASASFLPGIFATSRQTKLDQTATTSLKTYFESVRQTWSNTAAFDLSVAATGFPATPWGCNAPSVSDPDNRPAGSTVVRRRVTLVCGATTSTGFRSNSFIAEFGRP